MIAHHLVCNQCAELYNKPAPIEVTDEQLADAGGMITCPDCGSVCRERGEGSRYLFWPAGHIDVYAQETKSIIYRVSDTGMMPVLLRLDHNLGWVGVASIYKDRGIYNVLIFALYDPETDSGCKSVYASDNLHDCIIEMWKLRNTVGLEAI